MKGKTHFILSLFIGFFIVDFLPVENNEINRFIYLVIFCIGSLLPDIIEPAYNYNHRKFFHSKVLLIILLFFSFYLHENKEFLIFTLVIGYIFHLLLDSLTKRGLPLI